MTDGENADVLIVGGNCLACGLKDISEKLVSLLFEPGQFEFASTRNACLTLLPCLLKHPGQTI